MTITTKTKTTKEVPPNSVSLDERIDFARANAERGDKCKVFRDGAVIKEGFIVDLTLSRDGGCSHAKIYNQRNKNGDVGSGDLNFQTANWYPFSYKYGGVVLTGGTVKFDYNKAMYLSVA